LLVRGAEVNEVDMNNDMTDEELRTLIHGAKALLHKRLRSRNQAIKTALETEAEILRTEVLKKYPEAFLAFHFDISDEDNIRGAWGHLDLALPVEGVRFSCRLSFRPDASPYVVKGVSRAIPDRQEALATLFKSFDATLQELKMCLDTQGVSG
jgi:hypothetical protein